MPRGQYAEAEPLYKRSLAIMEKALGPDHPMVALSLNNLALLYRAMDRFAEAESLCYKRSLAIMEKALGPDHPDVATSLENLALLYRAIKREKEAEELEARAARIRSIKLTCPPHKDPASVIMFGDSSRLRPGGSTRT